MIKSLYAHDVTTVNLTVNKNHVDVELLDDSPSIFPVAGLTVFRSNLAPSSPPTVTFDGVDIPALLEAARAALRALDDAHEGNPASLPFGATEARARLISALTVVEASE